MTAPAAHQPGDHRTEHAHRTVLELLDDNLILSFLLLLVLLTMLSYIIGLANI
jgi:hypothetical protein